MRHDSQSRKPAEQQHRLSSRNFLTQTPHRGFIRGGCLLLADLAPSQSLANCRGQANHGFEGRRLDDRGARPDVSAETSDRLLICVSTIIGVARTTVRQVVETIVGTGEASSTTKRKAGIAAGLPGAGPELPQSVRQRLTRLKSASLVERIDRQSGGREPGGCLRRRSIAPDFSRGTAKKLTAAREAGRYQPDLDSFCG